MIKGKLHQLKRAAFQQCPIQKYTTTQGKNQQVQPRVHNKNTKDYHTIHITTVKHKISNGVSDQKSTSTYCRPHEFWCRPRT